MVKVLNDWFFWIGAFAIIMLVVLSFAWETIIEKGYNPDNIAILVGLLPIAIGSIISIFGIVAKEKMRKLRNILICFFTRHKPDFHLTFTDDYIYKQRCARCGCLMGMPLIRMGKYPPPGVTSTQHVKDWEEYVSKEENNAKERGLTFTYVDKKGKVIKTD